MSEHYAPKHSVFAYVSIFYKAKRHEGESVNDYMVRLRHLAGPCSFGTNLEKELLRAFVFGCGIEKVEELLSSDDGKTLKDAVKCGLKNEHKLEDLKQIWSAYAPEAAPTGGTINHASFVRSPQAQVINNCGWCGREPHERAVCTAKDKECIKCGKAGHFAAVCQNEQIKSQNKSFNRKSFDNKRKTAESSQKGNSVASTCKQQSKAKKRVSFTNELNAVSSKPMSRSLLMNMTSIRGIAVP